MTAIAGAGFAALSRRATAFVERCPWIGWAGWLFFCGLVLLRMDPQRFAPAFGYYLKFARRFAEHQALYDPNSLTDVSYWPTTLAVMLPFTAVDPTLAADIALSISIAALSWAVVDLMRAMRPGDVNALMLAGIVLLNNIMPAWSHFKHVQLHILMAAGMIAAAACIVRERWLAASLWLFVALAVKPIAIVMVLLCIALVPKTRWPLIVATIVAVLLPFALADASYVAEQYRLFGMKLWTVATAPPGQWIYQADFSTLLKSLGIVLPGAVSLPLRAGAAVGTLYLAWRVRGAGGDRTFALAVLILSGCYLTLFGPRNENVSFLVVTPALATLAVLMLIHDQADRRAWLLIAACFVLGFVVSLTVDHFVKPAIMTAVYTWLAWLMIEPVRWRRLVEGPDR
jgi:hypothetical protein